MLRIDFKYNRKLLTKLCHCAKESLEMFFRTVLGLDDGILGMIMVIHTSMPLSPPGCFAQTRPSIASPKRT